VTIFILLFLFISVVLLCDPKRAMYVRALGVTVVFYLVMAWIGLIYLLVKWVVSLFTEK
jgi:hypothetical protein